MQVHPIETRRAVLCSLIYCLILFYVIQNYIFYLKNKNDNPNSMKNKRTEKTFKTLLTHQRFSVESAPPPPAPHYWPTRHTAANNKIQNLTGHCIIIENLFFLMTQVICILNNRQTFVNI